MARLADGSSLALQTLKGDEENVQRLKLEQASRALVVEAMARATKLHLRVTSGSMRPLVHIEDSLLICSAQRVPKIGEILLFEKEGLALVHRVIDLRNEAVLTKGDALCNPDGWIPREAILGLCVAINGHRIDTPSWRWVNRQIARISPYSSTLRAPVRFLGKVRRRLGWNWL